MVDPAERDAGGVGLQRFTASDGASIAWEQDGSGRPILMLHGLMAHRGFFRAQAPLAEHFRLIGVDLRGHGESGGSQPCHSRESGKLGLATAAAPLDSCFRGDDNLGLDRLAADVAELAAHLDLDGAIGIGWSLGAAVLWRVLAGGEGARFAGAVIVDMTPKVLNEGGWTLGLTPEHCDARAAAFRGEFAAFAAQAGPAIFADGDALGPWAAREFARNDAGAMGAIWQSLVAADLRPLLPRIAQPSLIVHGAHSPLYDAATANYVAGVLLHARAIAFQRSAHAPQLEEPERFNALVTEFAASLPQIRQPQNMI